MVKILVNSYPDIFAKYKYDLGLAKVDPVEIHTTDNIPVAGKFLRKFLRIPNLARWAVELMQYDLYIEHVEGAVNRVADCMSRIADEISENDVKHLPDAQDIINFPISLYFTQSHCMYGLPRRPKSEATV